MRIKHFPECVALLLFIAAGIVYMFSGQPETAPDRVMAVESENPSNGAGSAKSGNTSNGAGSAKSGNTSDGNGTVESRDAVNSLEPVQSGDASEKNTGLININTADVAELMSLPGIGKTRAEAIISYRESQGQFVSVEDIMKVSGIKNGIFSKIKDLISVD